MTYLFWVIPSKRTLVVLVSKLDLHKEKLVLKIKSLIVTQIWKFAYPESEGG